MSETYLRAAAIRATDNAAAASSSHGQNPSLHASAEAAKLCSDPAAALLREGLRRPGGYVVLDGALSREQASDLHMDLITLLADGCLLPRQRRSCPKVQNGDDQHYESDHGTAMDEVSAEGEGLHAIASAIRLLKGIAHEVAQVTGSLSWLTACPHVQVAVFPGGGAHYEAHRDVNVFTQASGEWRTNWRVWTVILYANEGWQPEHGGSLRLARNDVINPISAAPRNMNEEDLAAAAAAADACDREIDVEPIAGRVLIFDSRRTHAVLPAWRERFALTLWLWREDDDSSKFGLSGGCH